MDQGETLIAIVDDDAGVLRALRRPVRSLSYRPATFATAEAFLESLHERRPVCVGMDLHLPGLKGVDVLDRIQTDGLALPVIIITGLDQPGMRDRCLAAGAVSYLTKPLDRSTLRQAIETALGAALPDCPAARPGSAR